MKFCSAPWNTITLQANGSIHSCLCGEWNSAGSIGNILENSLPNIMQSSVVQNFQSTIVDQSFRMCEDQCPKKWTLDTITSLPSGVAGLPTTVLCSIDHECNLKCPSCRSSRVWTGQVNPTAVRILNALTAAYQNYQDTVTLQCDGAGDVFASAAWQEFLTQAELPECFRFHFITNGNLIVKKIDLLTRLKSRIDSVDVSLDADQSNTYTAVRGGRLDTVLAGMRALIQQGIRVNVSFVVQQKNYTEMLACWETVSRMGCHSINFQAIRRFNHHTDAWWQENQLADNPRVDGALLSNQVDQLLQAPATVSLHGEGGHCPVHMNGDMRMWSTVRPTL
jgi:radical SAM protein with 4Fe4S-binding SPASM domain